MAAVVNVREVDRSSLPVAPYALPLYIDTLLRGIHACRVAEQATICLRTNRAAGATHVLLRLHDMIARDLFGRQKTHTGGQSYHRAIPATSKYTSPAGKSNTLAQKDRNLYLVLRSICLG